MVLRGHPTIRTVMTAIGVSCLLSSIASAQPPGRQGNGSRMQGEQPGARSGGNSARGADPAEIAGRMLKQYDNSQDDELQLNELVAALTAQTEGRAKGGRESQQGVPGKQGSSRQRGGRGQGQSTAQGRRGMQQGPRRSAEVQRQRGAGQQQGGVSRGQRGLGQARQRPAGVRGGQTLDPKQMAERMFADFDSNQSQGLDVRELTNSLQSQRAARGRSGGTGRSTQNPARAGMQPSRPDADQRQERGTGKGGRGGREESEPGTGVVPKRPGQ